MKTKPRGIVLFHVQNKWRDWKILRCLLNTISKDLQQLPNALRKVKVNDF